MPDWLIEILRQFPIVVVIGFAIWYAAREVSKKEIRLEERADRQMTDLQEREHRLRVDAQEREERRRQEIRNDRDAEISRFLEAQKEVAEKNRDMFAAKDVQIAELTKQLAALVRKIQG